MIFTKEYIALFVILFVCNLPSIVYERRVLKTGNVYYSKIADIHVTESFIDKYQVGKVQSTTYKSEQVYQTDLLIEPDMLGNRRICLLAKDVNG